jgi:N-acetylglucosamine-6-phosphate deacetylase
MKKVLKNCRIVSPGIDIPKGCIEIESDRIIAVSTDVSKKYTSDCKVYNLNHRLAIPGFIDMHTHGAGGYDSTDGTKESIEKIAELKLKEGVTTFCPTTLTLSKEKLIKTALAVEKYKNNGKFAKVAGIHLEGPYLSLGNIGAQNPNFVRKPDLNEVLEINDISKVAIVTLAIEVEGGVELVKALNDRSIVTSCGHSCATYAQFLNAKTFGLKHLTHFCNQMTKLHHREIGLVGAGLLDNDVLIEVICDKIHLSPEMIQLIVKTKGVDKFALITDSIAASWLQDGDYDLGGLPVTVKNSVATLSDKGNLAGSTLRYNIALRNIQEITNQPLSELIKTTSYNQSRSLGMHDLGKIKESYKADITVLNEKFEPEMVFVNGELKYRAGS